MDTNRLSNCIAALEHTCASSKRTQVQKGCTIIYKTQGKRWELADPNLCIVKVNQVCKATEGHPNANTHIPWLGVGKIPTKIETRMHWTQVLETDLPHHCCAHHPTFAARNFLSSLCVERFRNRLSQWYTLTLASQIHEK